MRGVGGFRGLGFSNYVLDLLIVLSPGLRGIYSYNNEFLFVRYKLDLFTLFLMVRFLVMNRQILPQFHYLLSYKFYHKMI